MIERTAFRRTYLLISIFALGAIVQSCGPARSSRLPKAAPAAAQEELERTPARPIPDAPVIAIPNARRPVEGVLTGGQPTPEQIDEAAAAGYRTVVNLRSSAEEGFEWERDRVEGSGMRYVQIEVAGGAGLTADNVARLARLLSDLSAMPMVLHCKSGNRVGALLALKAAWVDGVPEEEALTLGLEAGLTRLEAKTRELLADH